MKITIEFLKENKEAIITNYNELGGDCAKLSDYMNQLVDYCDGDVYPFADAKDMCVKMFLPCFKTVSVNPNSIRESTGRMMENNGLEYSIMGKSFYKAK